jgi:hypothetical protein
MSKGAGVIERRITDLLAATRDRALDIDEITDYAFRLQDTTPTRAQRLSATRAAYRALKRMRDINDRARRLIDQAHAIDPISARLGLPKQHVRKYIGGCVVRELLKRIDRGTGPILALTPTGLDAAMVRKPVQPVAAKPSPPPPTASPISPAPSSSASPPQPQATRGDVKPRSRVQLSYAEMRLAQRANELRILFSRFATHDSPSRARSTPPSKPQAK